MKNITTLLLAAGQSQRFPGNKMTAIVDNQQTLIQQSLKLYHKLSNSLLVVLRPNDLEIKQLLTREHVAWIECQNASQGMGASIVCGIQASLASDACLIALADMPAVQSKTVEALAHQLKHGAIMTAPYYKNRKGHPVGFGKTMQDELMNISPRQGAKSILLKFDLLIDKMNVHDPNIHLDIDTQHDLKVFVNNHLKKSS